MRARRIPNSPVSTTGHIGGYDMKNESFLANMDIMTYDHLCVVQSFMFAMFAIIFGNLCFTARALFLIFNSNAPLLPDNWKREIVFWIFCPMSLFVWSCIYFDCFGYQRCRIICKRLFLSCGELICCSWYPAQVLQIIIMSRSTISLFMVELYQDVMDLSRLSLFIYFIYALFEFIASIIEQCSSIDRQTTRRAWEHAIRMNDYELNATIDIINEDALKPLTSNDVYCVVVYIYMLF